MSSALQNMDVVILCGGMGTRLREVVSDRPKPMAAIGGKPFLQLLVEHVASFGFRRFILCAGYMAETIEKWVSGVGYRDGGGQRPEVGSQKSEVGGRETGSGGRIGVIVSREDKPLGTGGALWNATPLINGEMCVVLNGDSFCAVDYNAFIARHRETGAAATVAVTGLEDAGDYGTVNLDGSGRITGFIEKTGARQKGLVNAGVYAFDMSVLRGSRPQDRFSLERDVFPRLAAEGRLFGWNTPAPLLDIGTPERYSEAQSRLVGLMAPFGIQMV